jgi:phage baseplate assembly protein W
MAGINRETGQLLDGWPHVVQSIMLIITTGYGERMLRRWFGSAIPHLLGENLTTPTVVRFFAALIAALEVRAPGVSRTDFFLGPKKIGIREMGYSRPR